MILEGPALLEAIKGAGDDRARVRLVMDAFRRQVAEDAEKGMKVLRDGLGFFERVGVVDYALSRTLKEGLLASEHYPRLKRILEKHHAGRNLQSVFEFFAEQESPEQWKMVLGQLKLK